MRRTYRPLPVGPRMSGGLPNLGYQIGGITSSHVLLGCNCPVLKESDRPKMAPTTIVEKGGSGEAKFLHDDFAGDPTFCTAE